MVKKSNNKSIDKVDLDVIIKLQINGDIIEIPYDEAKKLYDKLDKIFGVVHEPIHPLTPITPYIYEPYRPNEPWTKKTKRPWDDDKVIL
jgi:hypothetical protein